MRLQPPLWLTFIAAPFLPQIVTGIVLGMAVSTLFACALYVSSSRALYVSKRDLVRYRSLGYKAQDVTHEAH